MHFIIKKIQTCFAAILIFCFANCHNPKKDANMNDAYEQVNPNNCNTAYSKQNLNKNDSANKKDSVKIQDSKH